MSIDWKKFDANTDLEGLNKDIKAADENGDKDYPEIPDDKYEVKIRKMELKTSKKGDPMVSIQFKILEGKYKGSLIFLNQVITKGFQIHTINNLFRDMFDTEIEFLSYSQYAELINNCAEEAENLSFALKYGTNTKGFKTYEITEVFEEQ
jgi:hypothetical protein